MTIPPNSPLFPLVAIADPQGQGILVKYGYWVDGKAVERFVAQFTPDVPDEVIQEQLNAFQTLANRVDALSDGWKPRVIGTVVAGDFGRVN